MPSKYPSLSYVLGQKAKIPNGIYALTQAQLHGFREVYPVCPECGDRLLRCPMPPRRNKETDEIKRGGVTLVCASVLSEEDYIERRKHFAIENLSAKTPYLYVGYDPDDE